MTGLSAVGNYAYVASRSQNRTYRYTLPGIAGRINSNPFTGYSETRDIAWCPDGTVWVASDWTSVPLRCFDASGTWVDYIDMSLVAYARGVALDPEGYLWVSDMENDKLYKIDLSEGVGGCETGDAVSLSVSSNPFGASVTISGSGFTGAAQLEIYDIRGRVVLHDDFEETFTWDGSSNEGVTVPSGAYFAFVADAQGNVGRIELLRI